MLMTPRERESISQMLQYVGRRYVPYINHTYHRTGTLWEGRFKASLIDGPGYLLACYRYIELNPVRAEMVESPEQYRWSSYRWNALGEADPVVQPHDLYLELSKDDVERRAAYRELFRGHLGTQVVSNIRAFLQTGTPLGNERFREEIERALKVKLGQSRRGRPRKRDEDR
jgi:putative transposase